jgi:transposase
VRREQRDQLQIDFGQKQVALAGVAVRIFLLVAVLSYSRRLFVKAFLNQRGDDWREGIAAAFVHFGGVPRVLLGDNARALGRDRANLLVTDPQLSRDRRQRRVSRPQFDSSDKGRCQEMHVDPPDASAV